MSTFTFNVYLIDDDGDGTGDNYVVTDPGDRIVISTQSIVVDTNYRYIGGQIAAKPGSSPALTFQIRKRTNNKWVMLVNRRTFCGMYDNREDCLGVLYGYYTHYSGLDDGFAVWLADSLEKGSILDADANDPFTFERDGNDYTATLGSPDADELDWDPSTMTLGIMLQYSIDPGSGTQVFRSFGVLSAADATTPLPFAENSTFTDGWLNQDDNTLARAVIIRYVPGSAYTVIEATDPIAKNETTNTDLSNLSLDLSGHADTETEIEVDDVAYPRVLGDAELQPGDSLTYTFDWYREVPELTSFDVTSSDQITPTPVVGTVTITEDNVGDYEKDGIYTFNAVTDGSTTATSLTYSWTVTGGARDFQGSQTSSSVTVQLEDAVTAYTIEVTVGATDPGYVGPDVTEDISVTTLAVAPTTITFDTPAAITEGDATASLTNVVTDGDPVGTLSYQWKVNSVNAGTDSATLDTSALVENDTVECDITSTNARDSVTVTADFGSVAAGATTTQIFTFTWDGTTGNNHPYTQLEPVDSSQFDVISTTSIRLRFTNTTSRDAFAATYGTATSDYELRNDTDSTTVALTSAGTQFSTSFKWDLGSSLVSGKTYTIVAL